MAKESKNLNDLFHDTLKDIYFAEKKILSTLPKMAKAAQSTDLKVAFEKHRGETEGHVARLEKIVAESGRIDVVVHNAGHMMFGPAEAFTPEQYAQQYDANVLGTQRVNRAVLPHMRAQKQGLLVWVSSSSTAGGTPPYLSPYFAAKAAMDMLAVQYARELARWGIETSIVVPGAFTKGTSHFAHSGRPADQARLVEYEAGPYKGFGEEVEKAFAAIVPDDADVSGVADAIVEIVSERGLGALSDGLEEVVDRAIAADPSAAEEIRSGNMKALGPIVGAVMRETKGRADGAEVRRLILERLG